MHSGLSLPTPPLVGTPRNLERPTTGNQIDRVARALSSRRLPLMPHQRHVMDVSQEYDPTTGHRWYRLIVWELMRQCGKSTGVDALLTRGGAGRPDRTSVYAAQDRQMAARRLLDDLEAKRLKRSPATRGRYKPVRSKGSEAIMWHNGSALYVIANTDTAGHGLTINGEAVLDEAFAHADLTVPGALSPAMVTCPDAQLWIISTPGDGSDGLLQHYEEVGDASLYDPDSRVAYFRWGRAEDEDPTDEAVWWRRIPALGTAEQVARGERTITIEALRSQLTTLGVAEFDRAYLCHRRTETYASKIPPEVWGRQADTSAVPTGPFVLAAEIAHDRTAASVAVCGWRPGGGRLVVVDRRGGTSWLGTALRDLQRQHRPAGIVGDRRGPLGSQIDRLALDLGPLLEPDTVQFGMSTGVLYDGLVDGEVWHAGQADLDVAVAQARTRPLGDSWAWSMKDSPVDVAPLRAATFAVWGHVHLFPGAGGGRIY